MTGVKTEVWKMKIQSKKRSFRAKNDHSEPKNEIQSKKI